MQSKEDIAKKLRSDYVREWRKRNPDKVRIHSKNYWERKAQVLIEANQIGSENDSLTYTEKEKRE